MTDLTILKLNAMLFCLRHTPSLNVRNAVFQQGTEIEIWNSTGDIGQQWKIENIDGWSYIITEDNMALSYDGNSIVLSEYIQADNQRWIIECLGEGF